MPGAMVAPRPRAEGGSSVRVCSISEMSSSVGASRVAIWARSAESELEARAPN